MAEEKVLELERERAGDLNVGLDGGHAGVYDALLCVPVRGWDLDRDRCIDGGC